MQEKELIFFFLLCSCNYTTLFYFIFLMKRANGSKRKQIMTARSLTDKAKWLVPTSPKISSRVRRRGLLRTQLINAMGLMTQSGKKRNNNKKEVFNLLGSKNNHLFIIIYLLLRSINCILLSFLLPSPTAALAPLMGNYYPARSSRPVPPCKRDDDEMIWRAPPPPAGSPPPFWSLVVSSRSPFLPAGIEILRDDQLMIPCPSPHPLTLKQVPGITGPPIAGE